MLFPPLRPWATSANWAWSGGWWSKPPGCNSQRSTRSDHERVDTRFETRRRNHMVISYPGQFDVDFPARPLDRWTTAFRIFVAIPILILFGTVSRDLVSTSDHHATTVASGVGLLFLPLVLMILFRQKYPRWWFDWNLNLLRFSNRVTAYLALLDDRYPSTDEEQAVHLNFAYPDARQLNRWLPLVKWFLAIPHYVVLFFLFVGAFFAILFAAFAVLFTRRYPQGLFGFVVGVYRWTWRLSAYLLLMVDPYPPFSLGEELDYPARIEIAYPGEMDRWRPFVQWLLA